MKAIYKEVGKMPQVVDIENTLEALQEAVGGYIEAVHVGDDIMIICDEEGRLKGSPYNFTVGKTHFVGNILFVQRHGEDFTDLDDVNEQMIQQFFELKAR